MGRPVLLCPVAFFLFPAGSFVVCGDLELRPAFFGASAGVLPRWFLRSEGIDPRLSKGFTFPPCPGVWSAATDVGVRHQGAKRTAHPYLTSEGELADRRGLVYPRACEGIVRVGTMACWGPRSTPAPARAGDVRGQWIDGFLSGVGSIPASVGESSSHTGLVLSRVWVAIWLMW